MDDEAEYVELGGNITLSGFREVPKAEMVVLKKIIGSYARKFADTLDKYENLSMHLKSVHGSQYEISGKLLHNSKMENSTVTDRNIFVAVDSVLKKLESIVM